MSKTLTWIVAFVLALAIPLALAQFGMSQRLGAHPWWALKTALIGAPLGAVLGFAVQPLGRRWGMILGVLVVAVSMAIARYGKTTFAASFAEDSFAGQLWYFGWIGAALGLATLIMGIFAPKPASHLG